MVRTFSALDYARPRVAQAKRGRRVSVVIPARDEAGTVGHVVGVAAALTDVVDEVLVVDDASSDDTAAAARAAGARVIRSDGLGKGGAMRTGLTAAAGDVVVFADADVTSFDSGFVLGLVGPLLAHDELVLVKGCYQRPGEGGRVNELVARPLLALLFPALTGVLQPLGGEYAGRRAAFEAVDFEDGYGVDIGLLLDLAGRHGVGALAQSDLGVRVHRNRPLSSLADASRQVMEVVLDRAGLLDQADVDQAAARRLA
ncbi:MAG: glucosyl-3-phosphoglycerate synthase [Acidimicrobiaceae bacterium]|jgi:glucosyl-3-phosphoglycerate synthase|nr:glucosyl-3-phosphoglycerate synthase [Acidimicrobiaceae bacterium]